jgi:NAD(P)-dependent dehydrogenase (short-subunit alcohol dehydrogenase family)
MPIEPIDLMDSIPRGERLSGKVAIITGAGASGDGIGTGRAAAIVFGAQGARVLVVDRDLAAAERTVEFMSRLGGQGEAFAADVTSPELCAAMVARALDRWGRVDILDNNVGVDSRGTVLEIDWDEWDWQMTVNVKSVAVASAAAIPAMSTQGGSIINISSISAIRPRGLTPYTTAKGAVIALTRAMAIDHGAAGIRVNCVVPGPLYTPMAKALGMNDEARERRRLASPLGIEGTAWDIANAALFLASEEARYITGAILNVDGGVSVRSPAR